MSNTDFNDFVEFFNGQAQQASSAIAAVQPDDDPDRAARAIKLGSATNTDPAAIYPQVDDFEHDHKTLLTSDLVSDNRQLQNYLNDDSMAAKLSHDDVINLDDMTQAMNDYHEGLKNPSMLTKMNADPSFAAATDVFKLTMEPVQAELQKKYDEYVDKYGPQAGSAIAALEGVGTYGMALPMAAWNGTVAGFTKSLQAFGMSKERSDSLLRDLVIGGQILPFMHELGGLGIHPKVAGEINAVADAIRAAGPYIRDGKTPPVGVHPLIDEAKVAETKADAGNFDKLVSAAEKTATKERSPEYMAKYVAAHPELADAKIAIDASAVARLYGDKVPEADDGLLGFIPNLKDRIASAADSGGYIEVPLSDYVGHIDREVHEELKRDILYRDNGLTVNEAESFNKPTITLTKDENVRRWSEGPATEGDTRPLIDDLETRYNYDYGGKTGSLIVEPKDEGKHLHIRWVGDADKPQSDAGVGSLGVAGVRALRDSLSKEFPDAETIGGHRLSGAREASPKDVTAPLRPSEPLGAISAPTQVARAAAGLEPLFSHGDRSVKLERMKGKDTGMFGEAQGFHDFHIVDQDGQQIGSVNISKQGDVGYIEMIQAGANKARYQPNYLGPALMRDLIRQIKEELGVKTLTGHRVTGAREKAGTFDEPHAMINLNEIHDPTELEKFRDLLNSFWGGEVRSELPVSVATHLNRLTFEGLPEMNQKILTEVAGRLRELVGDIPVIFNKNLQYDGKDVAGLYRPGTDVIHLRSAYDGETAIHEAVHAATSKILNSDDSARHGVSRLMKAFEESAGENLDALEKYALTNEKEFIAAALSSPEFQTRLSQMEMPKDSFLNQWAPAAKNMWQAVVATIRKILGLPEGSETILEATLRVSDKLMREQQLDTAGARGPTDLAQLPKEPSTPLEHEQVPLPFGDHRTMGIPKATYERYMRLIRRQQEEDIKADYADAYTKERRIQSKEWQENRAEIRQQVEDEIGNRPDLITDRLMSERGGELKIDPMSVDEELRGTIPKEYTRMTNSVSAEDLATHFGYPSAEAFIKDLAETAKDRMEKGLSHRDYVKSLVDAETDRRMEVQYGFLEKNVLEEAKDRALSQNQIDLLHEESHMLAEQAGLQFPLDRSAMQAKLREGLDATPVEEIKSDRWIKAAGKAGRAAEEALLRSDFAEAFRVKQVQANATQMAKWAHEYEKDRAKFDKLAKRYRGKPNDKTVKRIETVYYDYIQQLLQRTGHSVRRDPVAISASLEHGGYDSFRDFVNYQRSGLKELKVADWLMDEQLSKDVDRLSHSEYNELHDAIATMDFVGRADKKILLEGEKADLDEIIEQITDQIREALPSEGGREATPRQGKLDVARAILWSHVTPEAMWNRLDRGDKKGLLNRLLSYPASQAGNYKSKLLRDFGDKIAEIGKIPNMDKLVENTLWRDPYDGTLMIMRKRNVLGIIQNWGNISNRRKLLEGYGVKEEDALAWLKKNSLPEDWERAQKIGDIYKEIHAMADRMSYNVSGRGIDPLPIESFENPHGVIQPGWYNPVKYDPIRPGKSQALMGKDALEQEGFFRATTPQGYTKNRTKYVAPIELNIDVVPTRMKQMIHDIAMRPAINEMSKIIYNTKFQNAVIAHYGRFPLAEMKSYMEDIANSANFLSDTQHVANQALEILRQNTISTLIGLNPSTVMKHVTTAAINSVSEVGVKNFTNEFFNMFRSDPRTGLRNWQMAWEKSEELQRRMKNYQDLLRGHDADISFNPGSVNKARETMMYLGSLPVSIGDFASAVPTWLAEYKKQLRGGADEGMAIQLADRAVRQAHGSSAITNRPSVMRSTNAFGQAYASLYGFFSHMLQKQYQLAWTARDMLNGRKPQGAEAPKLAVGVAGSLAVGLFSYVIAPALIEEMVTPYNNSNKDNWGKKAALTLGMGASSSFIGVRDAVRSMINQDDPQLGIFPAAVKSGTDLYRDLNKTRPFSREHAANLIKHSFTLTGILTGLTNAQEGRIAGYIQRYNSNLERPKGPWDTAVGLRYGTTEKHSHTFEEWWKHTIQGKHQ